MKDRHVPYDQSYKDLKKHCNSDTCLDLDQSHCYFVTVFIFELDENEVGGDEVGKDD